MSGDLPTLAFQIGAEQDREGFLYLPNSFSITSLYIWDVPAAQFYALFHTVQLYEQFGIKLLLQSWGWKNNSLGIGQREMPSLPPYLLKDLFFWKYYWFSTHKLLQSQHKWEGRSKAWDCFTVEILVVDLCLCPLNRSECSQRCGNYSAFCAASFFCAITGPKPAFSAKSHRTKDQPPVSFQHLSS